MSGQLKAPNRLSHETSPYLLQHADNLIDRYTWGTGATEKAEFEDKPIILTNGYAACHWGHVMEQDSFESADAVSRMNRACACVTVDREERPDLDLICIIAVWALTGFPGWPLSVLLTPDRALFFGATFFLAGHRPKTVSWLDRLRQVALAWKGAGAYLNVRPRADHDSVLALSNSVSPLSYLQWGI